MMHRSDRSRLSAAPAGAAGLLTLALLVGPPLAGMDAMSSTAAPAQATAASATEDGHLPMALVGQWAFTTISGTTYWDKSTGAYLGDGTGASQTYTFERNGKYRMFTYIKTRSYGWQIQTLTWEEGAVILEGDRLILRPTGGRYQVMDNRVAKNNYQRPMRDEELKKNVKAVYWSLVKDGGDGKPVLMMGTTKDALLRYKHVEP
jgi:hypothetical protein